MTAKHIQSLGPSSCLTSWEKSKPSEQAQRPAATALTPACFYTMIFKSQIKQQQKKIVGALILVSPLPSTPFPSRKPPAGIGPQNNKEFIWGKKKIIALPSCSSAQYLGNKKNKLEKSQKASCFLKHPGAKTPWGEVKFALNAERRGETNREKRGTGGRQNNDIPQRGSCGYTSTEAPPTGYTRALDSQTKRTQPWEVNVTIVSINQRWLRNM